MSSTSITVLVIIIVVVLLLIGAAVYLNRRRALRSRFGPEYDRAVAEHDSRTDAERELRERERRHAELELKPLDPASRDRYVSSWEEIQVRFVDAPEEAVGQADALVTELIAECGYPTGDYDAQVAHLSVDHARTLGHYRQAHDINAANERGEATTEQLRQALVHYRALFADLLGTAPAPDREPDREPDRAPEPVREATDQSATEHHDANH